MKLKMISNTEGKEAKERMKKMAHKIKDKDDMITEALSLQEILCRI